MPFPWLIAGGVAGALWLYEKSRARRSGPPPAPLTDFSGITVKSAVTGNKQVNAQHQATADALGLSQMTSVEQKSFSGMGSPGFQTIPVGASQNGIGYMGVPVTNTQPTSGQPEYDLWLQFLLSKGYLERDASNRIWIKHPAFPPANLPLSAASLWASYQEFLAHGWTNFQWTDDAGNYLSKTGAQQVAAEEQLAGSLLKKL